VVGRNRAGLAFGVVALLAGLSVSATGPASGEEPTPAPAPALTSTPDELTDMVMAAIEQGSAPELPVPMDPPQ
jgi:hypothetical protein